MRCVPRKPLILCIAMAVFVAIGIAIVAIFPPNDTPWYPVCMFHQLTGWHCPGCGLTRSLHALLNGRVMQSLAYNPLLVVGLCWTVWEAAARGVYLGLGVRKAGPANWMIWSFVALLLLFGIVRNIPIAAFELLAPHEIQER